jgi:uncharacterized protein involved in type VI secretion and phage assembly
MGLERIVADLIEKIEHRFYGKYRGIVVDNQDPAKLGRLKLKVPSVLGADVVTGWAMPCVPYGGATNQGFLFVPDVGAGVWTEFEEGDLEFPIWTGTFWSKPDADSELPKPNQPSDGEEASDVQDPPTAKIIKTAKGHTLQLEDADGAEMVLIREGSQGLLLVMDQNGITITDHEARNIIQMSDSGFTITATVPFKIDASGQPVTIIGDTIDLKKG